MSDFFPTYEEKTCLNPSADTPASCPPIVDEEPTPDPEPPYYLIIKPGYALRQVGESIQYRTYLVSDVSGEEIEITQGLTYRSSDPTLAMIGALSGRAFGVVESMVTISVEWQDLTAYAQLEVTSDCANEKVGMMLVLDHSASMSEQFTAPPVVAGQAAYATRLDFAKALAHRFAGEVDTDKDYAGLVRFHEESSVIHPLTQDTDTLKVAINATAPTVYNTRIGDAITVAAQALDEAFDLGTITRKVIILFSDGENKDGEDPEDAAQAFKNSGGVIVVVGARANADGFETLQVIATDGLLLNGLKTNSTSVAGYLSETKGYYCAGNCVAQGNETINMGQLNYDSFVWWTVSEDTVDLLGGDYPYETFNLLPGNGLYVDLAGSGPAFEGKIILGEPLLLVAGHDYKLSYYLAGNQREDIAGQRTRVRVENVTTAIDYVDVTQEIDDFRQDFTLYEHEFTATGADQIQISFKHLNSGAALAYGNLLDRIVLEDLTDVAVVFEDDFDTENPLYVEPICVESDLSLLSGYGYCPGYGCLDEPIPAQVPDPNPLPVKANG